MNSKNPSIQALMEEVDRIDAADPELEAKLQLIARKVAEEQQKVKSGSAYKVVAEDALIDPADAFACEACQ